MVGEDVSFSACSFIYFGCAGSSMQYGASHCSGFSGCRAQALGYVAFTSCSTWVLSVQSTDSVVVEHGLPACGLWSRGLNSCSKVRGISVAPSGIMSHALQGRFFITRLPGKSAESFHHIKKKNKTFQEIWIPTTV